MEALEAETNLQDLRLEVYNDLKKREHPIEVEGYNVCQLTQKNQLMSLKVNYLENICDTIDLTIEGPQIRKLKVALAIIENALFRYLYSYIYF